MSFPLLGDHNVANALAASLAAREAGADPTRLAAGLRSFKAIPHRVEPIREVDGVLWINDSKSTNVTSTEVAVTALERPFVLLLGGRHKGAPYSPLIPLLKGRCRAVVAYGEAERSSRQTSKAHCRSSGRAVTFLWCWRRLGGGRGRETPFCCLRPARATTCSTTTRSAAIDFGQPCRRCERNPDAPSR
jgi:UDP-N-acetylmuramoylalanine-D-glutamate ligase